MTPTNRQHRPPACTADLSPWLPPVWPPHVSSPEHHPPPAASPPRVLREFAGLAAPIGLAAWMFGTALTSSCAPADVAGWSTGVARRAGAVGAGIEAVPAGPDELRCVPSVQAVAVSVPVAR
jgi:hypothetical protein